MKNLQIEAILAHEQEEAEKLQRTKEEAHAYHVSVEGQLIKTAMSTAAIKEILERNQDG